ncbi:uncharacterized protein LOC135372732 [Ornithodoros turicata]|uniref:uncharacterized protein LOC135372732 n=1 Tax=Ornithodoros turicata TaxID=34597 RepID=UPI0031390997
MWSAVDQLSFLLLKWKEARQIPESTISDQRKMETRCTELAAMTMKGQTQEHEGGCDHDHQMEELKKGLAELQEENNELRQENVQLREELASTHNELKDKKAQGDAVVKMIKKLRRWVRTASSSTNGRAPATEDIGNGVHVGINTLERLKATYIGAVAALSFAHNLLRAVFQDDELLGKSLFELQSNLCKENVTEAVY